MNPKPSSKDAGSNQMMISEVKSLKERLKVLETDNKLLRSREVVTTGPVITQQEFNKVRNALLNLLVAVENTGVHAKQDGELEIGRAHV